MSEQPQSRKDKFTEKMFGFSPPPEPPQECTPEQLARETVLSFRGKLSDPETFEYLYEIVLRAIKTAIAKQVCDALAKIKEAK